MTDLKARNRIIFVSFFGYLRKNISVCAGVKKELEEDKGCRLQLGGENCSMERERFQLIEDMVAGSINHIGKEGAGGEHMKNISTWVFTTLKLALTTGFAPVPFSDPQIINTRLGFCLVSESSHPISDNSGLDLLL